jgi:2,3-bisphosphoglycerate-independent phosphoglycerate mutase
MDVGLPEGQMGNSEVGHLNLGAGRIVYQDLTRINKSHPRWRSRHHARARQKAFAKAKGKRLHFLGLISDGGVHSATRITSRLAMPPRRQASNDLMVHAITDGRDTSPNRWRCYLAYWKKLDLKPSGAKIATVIGRYYAMDRDKRWERNKLAWDAIVLGRGEVRTDRPAPPSGEKYPATRVAMSSCSP